MHAPTKKNCSLPWVNLSLAAVVLAGCDQPRPTAAPPAPPPISTPTVVEAPPSQESFSALKTTIPEVNASAEKTQPVTPAVLAHQFRAATDPEARGELVADLWEIGTPEAVETLRQLFVGERETDVKVDIVSGVVDADRVELRDGCHALLLAALTPGQPPELRALSAHLLTESGDPRAIAILQQFAQDADPNVREAARNALETRREKQ